MKVLAIGVLRGRGAEYDGVWIMLPHIVYALDL